MTATGEPLLTVDTPSAIWRGLRQARGRTQRPRRDSWLVLGRAPARAGSVGACEIGTRSRLADPKYSDSTYVRPGDGSALHCHSRPYSARLTGGADWKGRLPGGSSSGMQAQPWEADD